MSPVPGQRSLSGNRFEAIRRYRLWPVLVARIGQRNRVGLASRQVTSSNVVNDLATASARMVATCSYAALVVISTRASVDG